MTNFETVNRINHIDDVTFKRMINEIKSKTCSYHMPEELFKCIAHVMRTFDGVQSEAWVINTCCNLVNSFVEANEQIALAKASDEYKTDGGKNIDGNKDGYQSNDDQIEKVIIEDEVTKEILKLEVEAKEGSLVVSVKRSARNPHDYKTFQARCQCLASKLRERLVRAIQEYARGESSWNPDNVIGSALNKYTKAYNDKFGTSFDMYMSKCNFKYWANKTL